MPSSSWAPNDWVSSDKITHTHLNNIGNSMRTWGYGLTPGTVTINANSNAVSAMGALTFAASKSINNLTAAEIVGDFPLIFKGAGFKYLQCESPHVAYYKKGGQNAFYWRKTDTGYLGGANEQSLMTLDDNGELVLHQNQKGLWVNDSARQYKVAVGQSATGQFSIRSMNSGAVLFACGDADVYLYVGGGLRLVTRDVNGFLKA